MEMDILVEQTNLITPKDWNIQIFLYFIEASEEK